MMMMTERLILIGTGGHGRVVLDAALAAGWTSAQITLRDGDTTRAGAVVCGLKVHTPEWADGSEELPHATVHVSVGDNTTRAGLIEEAEHRGVALTRIVHPRAVIATKALGAGCFVAAGAIISPDASIGAGAIVNHVAVVDHDCVVGEFAHVAPGAVLGGGVRVGRMAMVGANATVLPGLTIGEGAIVGAGSVVTRDVPAHATWVGVPAAPVRRSAQ